MSGEIFLCCFILLCLYFGAAGYYAAMAAEERIIGLSMSSVDVCMIVPGARASAGRINPIVYAIPVHQRKPIFLDIATSTVAASKVFRAKVERAVIPDGRLLDEEGHPTSDPVDYPEKAILVPIAGDKDLCFCHQVTLKTENFSR